MRMRLCFLHRIGGIATGMCLGLFAGCSSAIEGAYDGGQAPEGTAFHIARATFKEDRTFSAFAKFGDGEGKMIQGVYDFDGFKLKVKQAGKKEREYSATYDSFRKSLNITGPDGKSQVLKRM